MRDILSQEEIDALLEVQLDATPATAAAAPAGAKARPYDLASRQRLRRETLPGLERLNQRLAEQFRVSLSRLLGRDTDVSPQALQHSNFGEYRHGLYIPSSLTLLRLAPLGGLAMVMADARLVFRMVDIVFGGDGRGTALQGREFSLAEQRLIARFGDLLVADLESAWSPLLPLQCDVLGREVNPLMASIAGAGDGVLLCRFLVDSQQAGGEFHLVFPLTTLEPLRERLARPDVLSRASADPQWQRALQAAVMETRVATRCALAEKHISLRQLAALQVGDVIDLGSQDQSLLKAAGIPWCRGRLGVVNDALALKIKETL